MKTISDKSQNRVPNSYASAPELDLTLITNGEEPAYLIDGSGFSYAAGIIPPPSPSVVTSGATPTYTTLYYFSYVAVYAIAGLNSAIQHGASAGGFFFPRSNASIAVQYRADIAGNAHTVTVTNPVDTRIDRILIYRTIGSAILATDSLQAAAGQFQLLTIITVEQHSGTVSYLDNSSTLTGTALSLDNFVPPIFRHVIYSAPYFYGIGNDDYREQVTIDAVGNMQLDLTANPSAKWFVGRNAQIVKLLGVDEGGFDGRGSFYFKWVDENSAQLCIDLQLLQVSSLEFNGTTQVRIRGFANILYRSMALNPHAWGYTEVINEANVPTPFGLRVGAGVASAMTIIENLSVLKVDMVEPAATYTFNLRLAEPSDFAASKRTVANSVSITEAATQLAVLDTDRAGSKIGLDSNAQSIFITDGNSHMVVSESIFDTLQQIDPTPANRRLSHAIYDRFHDAYLFFIPIRVANTTGEFYSTCLAYIHKRWFRLQLPDITCSASIYDRVTGTYASVVGNLKGWVGKLFDTEQGEFSYNWISALTAETVSSLYYTRDALDFTKLTTDYNPDAVPDEAQAPALIGTWTVIAKPQAGFALAATYFARIASLSVVGTTVSYTFDRIYQYSSAAFVAEFTGEYDQFVLYPGLNLVRIDKILVASKDWMKVAAVGLTTSKINGDLDSLENLHLTASDYQLNNPAPQREAGLFVSNGFKKQSPLALSFDTGGAFIVSLSYLGYDTHRIINYNFIP